MISYDEDEDSETVGDLLKFTCVEEFADAADLKGCQLVDDFGKCFGYSINEAIGDGTGNFQEDDDAETEIRLQWQEFLKVGDEEYTEEKMKA